jgi:hypothetical protein
MRKVAFGLGLLALSLSRAPIASADTYQLGGPAASAVWSSYDGQMATQAIILTVSDAKGSSGNGAQTARCTFNVLQWGFTFNGLVFKHFYGDAELPAGALTVPADMSAGSLDAMLKGTLVSQVGFNYSVRRDVTCRLKCDWVPSGEPQNGQSNWTYQVMGYGAALSAAITGRPAAATATAILDGVTLPLGHTNYGSIAQIVDGALSVSVR